LLPPSSGLIALMLEAARSSETLVNFYQTTRCYNPEDSNLQVTIGWLNMYIIRYGKRNAYIILVKNFFECGHVKYREEDSKIQLK
jgi:hypothetical protein